MKTGQLPYPFYSATAHARNRVAGGEYWTEVSVAQAIGSIPVGRDQISSAFICVYLRPIFFGSFELLTMPKGMAADKR